MKNIYSLLIIIVFIFSIAGCKKDDSNPASQTTEFTNKLTLGTGADYSSFKITGESLSFTRIGGTASIFWRLESVLDMAGSSIQIKLEKSEGGSFVAYSTLSFPAAQNYGHITISSFQLKDVGTYKATGIIVNQSYTVASLVFTVQ